MLFREAQIDTIKQTFSHFKKFGMASNLIVMGVTGGGKTMAVKKTIQEESNFIYASCLDHNSIHKLLKAITGANKHSISDLQSIFISQMKKDPKILIIDEIGKIKDIEEISNILNAIYRSAGIPIIIITNKWTFVEEMPDDARLTLFFNKVEFASYNALQLKEILKERINIIKNKHQIPEVREGALEYISGNVIKRHFGSARVAIQILSACIYNSDFSQKFIDKKMEDIEDQDWRNFIYTLSDTEKKFFETIIELSENKEEIIPSDITNLMDVSPERVSQMITYFASYGVIRAGVIKAEYKNLGKMGGRYRVITFPKPEYRKKLMKILKPWDGQE